jgi:hypothetical protein
MISTSILVSAKTGEAIETEYDSGIAPPTPEEALASERAAMICTRAQGKLAIGPEIWAQVVAMADDPETPWGLRVAVHDTYEWRRLDTNMDALIWAMQLTPEDADDLFRLAMTL